MSVFTQHKYNRGRVIREQWVFGGIDITTKKCFLVPVERRDAATLLPIVQQYIFPGSTIGSTIGGHIMHSQLWECITPPIHTHYFLLLFAPDLPFFL